VDNFVENSIRVFRLRVKDLAVIFKTQCDLWKTLKLPAKKIFQIKKNACKRTNLTGLKPKTLGELNSSIEILLLVKSAFINFIQKSQY
jgi:hypothetical protein